MPRYLMIPVPPTGLIISPSHEAIQTDVPPANIKAMIDEAGEIYLIQSAGNFCICFVFKQQKLIFMLY